MTYTSCFGTYKIIYIYIYIIIYINHIYIYIYIILSMVRHQVIKSRVRFLWHPRLQKLQAKKHLDERWQNGVCHRDLKPENFLLMKKGPIRGVDVDGDGEIFCGSWMVAGYICTAISWCIYIYDYMCIYIYIYISCVYIIVYIIVV